MFSYTLNLILPGLVIVCCALFGLFNLFLSIRLFCYFPTNAKFIFVNKSYIFDFRKRFPIKVNCWFCNTNSKVPYENYNSFVCQSCQQFNGFKDDGSYIKEIPEQHFSKLNTSRTSYCQRVDRKLPITNGLCATCNRHQEMKIIQLANFKPRIEANFDEEIEEYKQKIEDSYQLCQQCSRHVNKTLNRIKTKFISSKLTQVFKESENIMKKFTQENHDGSKFFDRTVIFGLFLLSAINLMKEIGLSFDIIPNMYIKNMCFHIVALKMTLSDIIFKNILKDENISDLNIDGFATTAILINSYIFIKQGNLRLLTIISLLLCSFSMLTTELPLDEQIMETTKVTFIGCIALLAVIMFAKSLSEVKKVANENGSFHKLNTEVMEQEEESDQEVDVSHNSSYNGQSTIIYSPSVSAFTSVSQSMYNRSDLNRTRTFPPSPNMLNISKSSFLRKDNINSFELMSNRSFSIRDEVVVADSKQVQKDINKLNISDQFSSTSTVKDFNTSKNLNPFSLENSRCGSPSPSIASVFSGASRTQVISPPRLDSSSKGDINWIAGGYWSSPQKQQLLDSTLRPETEMSRSSSQSSGLGTIDSDKNSRENSITNEEVQSSFSEPRRGMFEKSTFLFDKPSTSRSLFEPSFTRPKPNIFFNNTNNTNNSFRKYRDTSFFK